MWRHRVNGQQKTRFQAVRPPGMIVMGILIGRKQIAECLRMTARTAQRWEQLGLPVRRVSDSTRSPIVADSVEIEHWVRAKRTSQQAGDPAVASTPCLSSNSTSDSEIAQGVKSRKTGAQKGARFHQKSNRSERPNLPQRPVELSRPMRPGGPLRTVVWRTTLSQRDH